MAAVIRNRVELNIYLVYLLSNPQFMLLVSRNIVNGSIYQAFAGWYVERGVQAKGWRRLHHRNAEALNASVASTQPCSSQPPNFKPKPPLCKQHNHNTLRLQTCPTMEMIKWTLMSRAQTMMSASAHQQRAKGAPPICQ